MKNSKAIVRKGPLKLATKKDREYLNKLAEKMAPSHFTVGPGSVVTIKGTTFVLTEPHKKGCGWWHTEQGTVIDVVGATQDDTLDAATFGAEEVYDREKSRALVGQINQSIKRSLGAPQEKKQIPEKE